jgi:MFS transporter, DHA2 family, methylenomycin A resistance protein
LSPPDFAQGAGAAVMMPSSMVLIHHAYPEPPRRARAVGMWAMGGAVAAAAGPVLGGLLSLASWRLIFLINIPVGVIAFILLAKSLHAPRHDAPFDWIGQVTAILAVGGLTYGAIEAGAAGFAALKPSCPSPSPLPRWPLSSPRRPVSGTR